MHPRQLTILLLLALPASLSPSTVRAQLSEKKYSAAELKKDFTLLRQTLQKKYPSLYRYKTKAAMDALIDSCDRSIHDSMPLYEFYHLTGIIISALEDGHASAQPSDRSIDDL